MPSTVKDTPLYKAGAAPFPFYFLVFSFLLLRVVRLPFLRSCANEDSHPSSVESFELIEVLG